MSLYSYHSTLLAFLLGTLVQCFGLVGCSVPSSYFFHTLYEGEWNGISSLSGWVGLGSFGEMWVRLKLKLKLSRDVGMLVERFGLWGLD